MKKKIEIIIYLSVNFNNYVYHIIMSQEENYQDPEVKFPTTGSLEPCKSSFFTGDLILFMKELTSGKYRIYFTEYRYSSEYDGSPTFILDNLLRGFVQQLEEKRKYLFTGFKCTKNINGYNISGIWITNCTLPMEQIAHGKYDDFEWEELDANINAHSEKMLRVLQRESSTNVVATSYLH